MPCIILIVEDDELLRPLTEEAISLLDLAVVACATADDALVVLEGTNTIGLVISDICMPGSMDGLELAKVIWDRWPHLPVILTSGNKFVIEASLPLNAMFLRKPWSLDVLHQAVRKFIPTGIVR